MTEEKQDDGLASALKRLKPIDVSKLPEEVRKLVPEGAAVLTQEQIMAVPELREKFGGAVGMLQALIDLSISNIEPATAIEIVPIMAAALALRAEDVVPERRDAYEKRVAETAEHLAQMMVEIRTSFAAVQDERQLDRVMRKLKPQPGEVGQ